MKKLVVLAAVAGLLFYWPTAHASGPSVNTLTGCLATSGKSLGKVSKIADSDTTPAKPCTGSQVQVQMDHLGNCNQGEMLKYDVMNQGWNCATDNDTPSTPLVYARVLASGMTNGTSGITSVSKPSMSTGVYCVNVTNAFTSATATLTIDAMNPTTARVIRIAHNVQNGCPMGTDLTILVTSLTDTAVDEGFDLIVN